MFCGKKLFSTISFSILYAKIFGIELAQNTVKGHSKSMHLSMCFKNLVTQELSSCSSWKVCMGYYVS